jgi:hypothetical protein
MAILGYARVSTNGQDLAGQVATLQAGCVRIYREKASGAKTDRPELAKLLRALGPGDVPIVMRLDRLPLKLCCCSRRIRCRRPKTCTTAVLRAMQIAPSQCRVIAEYRLTIDVAQRCRPYLRLNGTRFLQVPIGSTMVLFSPLHPAEYHTRIFYSRIGGTTMALYMAQFAYTPEAWTAFTKHPEDRTKAVQSLAQKLGCHFEALYCSLGEYDGFRHSGST